MELPLFPLPKTILLPGVVMPLHFFEPRYVRMIEDVLNSDPRHLVMSRLHCKDDMDYFLSPGFESVGCIGEIVEHQARANGTHDVILIGLERASLVECKSSDARIYRMVRATPMPYSELSAEQLDWLGTQEEPVMARLERNGHGHAVAEVFRKWREGFISARTLLHIFIHSLVQDPDHLQRILASDDAAPAIEVLRDWIGTQPG